MIQHAHIAKTRKNAGSIVAGQRSNIALCAHVREPDRSLLNLSAALADRISGRRRDSSKNVPKSAEPCARIQISRRSNSPKARVTLWRRTASRSPENTSIATRVSISWFQRQAHPNHTVPTGFPG